MLPETGTTVNNCNAKRLEKARRLLEAGLVQYDDGCYIVGSESLPGWGHIVTPRNGTHPAACTCRDYLHRQAAKGERCAHLWAAYLAEVQLRETRARLRAELATPAPTEQPKPPKRYRRDVVVIIRRPRVVEDQRALGRRLARYEGEQSGLRRDVLCGTVADWPGADDHPAHP
jgi:hypothetical protein